jgi:hypothetical protein
MIAAGLTIALTAAGTVLVLMPAPQLVGAR